MFLPWPISAVMMTAAIIGFRLLWHTYIKKLHFTAGIIFYIVYIAVLVFTLFLLVRDMYYMLINL